MKTIPSSIKQAEQRRSNRHRHSNFHILTTVCIILIIFFTFTFIFNRNTSIPNILFNTNPKTTLFNNQTLIIHHFNLIIKDSKNNNLHEFDILNSNKEFETRANDFFKDCKLRFFMTWISSSYKLFGEREFLAVDALFQSNPHSCLMILSNTMDSDYGFQILKPVTDLGFQCLALEPDLTFLFDQTPAKSWFDHIKNGNRDPGEIPLAQNLSNLIRLAVLYKYGGVYIDTDFIPLKDFSGLRNSIGAQSATQTGNWTRLNNAVLIFDKNHSLLYNFIKEFALTFDGNKWGYNGPYLVSRVVEREAGNMNENLSVLAPAAFYPVGWTRIGGLFRRPVNRVHRRWVEAKVVQLKELSYGVHLWNKQSRGLRIEEESIVARLVAQHCVVCKSFKGS